MNELSEKELELLAEQLVNEGQISPEIQTPCRSVFKFISWGFFLLCFNLTFFSFDFYPYFSLLGTSLLVFGFWHFANKNAYFEKVWKISIFIMAARIAAILIASTSILYRIAIMFTLPLNILVFVAFYFLFQNFELGLKDANVAIKKNIFEKLKHYALVLLLFPIAGTLLQTPVFQIPLFICYVITLILLIKTLLRLGNAMDTLCYTIDRRNPSEIRSLKFRLWGICILSAFCMFGLMLLPTQKHKILTKDLTTESQLNSYKEFEEILSELPDSELEYYKKPIKNIEVQTWDDNDMYCTIYMTEFEKENNLTELRYLYKLQYKETSFHHRFRTNGYIGLINGDFPHNRSETINVFYSENGHTYASALSGSTSHGLIGGEVPEGSQDTCYYFGVSQYFEMISPPESTAIYYFRGLFPYSYPYKPASERAIIWSGRSKCFYVNYDPEITLKEQEIIDNFYNKDRMH